jgi:plasmid stability protein
MPDQLIVRGLPDGTLDAIRERAEAAGQSQEAWVRQQIQTALAVPAIKTSYKLRAVGPNDASVVIGRWQNGLNAIDGKNMSQEQADAYQKAKLLVERNAPGDRERAIGLLSAAFEDVFEVAG